MEVIVSVTPDAVIRTWFEEVWNQGREETIARIFAEDAVAHGLPGSPMRGPDAFKALLHAFRGAFPDIRISVERTVTEGEMVTAHCHVTGTHQGPMGELAATNRPIAFDGVTIARITDGRIREGWNVFDFLTMYQQLGVVPQMPGA